MALKCLAGPRRASLVRLACRGSFSYTGSTAQQGASGLGVEAQAKRLSGMFAPLPASSSPNFRKSSPAKRTTGRRSPRPWPPCRLRRATHRQARPPGAQRLFYFEFDGNGVDFVACDNPHATRLTIHILAAVAEHERDMISARPKAALATAKVRGVKLGKPHLNRATVSPRGRPGGPGQRWPLMPPMCRLTSRRLEKPAARRSVKSPAP
jgi:hypothetical protein